MENTFQEHNATTNEITIREMTIEELKQYENDKKASVIRKAEAEAAETAKAALLARLGITADEAKLLLGGN